MKPSRTTIFFLVIIMLSVNFLTGFTYQQGIENVYYETRSELYDQVSFHRQLAGHSVNGIQRTYFVNADTRGTDLKPYVFAGEVTGTYTMDAMISTLENQGYKVVAGINGDVFDMSTGVPKGLTIHEGQIKTSGYAPEYVIAFDKNGVASLEYVNLSYALKGTINVPTVVMPPITDLTPSEDDSAITEEDSWETEDSEETAEPRNGAGDDSRTVDPVMGEDPEMVPETIYIPQDFYADISYFNVPHGESRALHLYNRQYGPATKTSGNCVEVVLEAFPREDAELTVGGTITALVIEIRNGACNTPIGDNQLVLSTPGDSAYAVQLAQLIPGSEVEISVADNNRGKLSHSTEVLGVYHLLYDNGQYFSSGTNINPRTVIGIKPDGALMLYVLDGRQPGFSVGLGLTDTARHLVALGCKTVVNMDGGGSSVIAVREGGLDAYSVAKNSPSEKTQRKVANGLFLVYDRQGDLNPANLHTYPSLPLAMPGAEIQLTTYASNNKYEPVRLRNNIEYWVNPRSGSTVDKNGLFTAGDITGTAVIEVDSGDLSTTARIDIQNDITFTSNVQSLRLEPEQNFDIDITAYYGYASIASSDRLFTWSCDPEIGVIDTDGLFQAVDKGGVSGHIYIEYNDRQQIIPVQVGEELIDFADTTDHWAREYIGRLAARGIVKGVGDDCYLPDYPLTRAQFLTMLANTVKDLDVTQAWPAGFADVLPGEWYYNYVNWGFEQGIVSGFDDNTFGPDENITREQMAVILDNFTASTGVVLPEDYLVLSFIDSQLISPWAAYSVDRVVAAGLMGGYPEGDYKPQGNATRAEAATVMYKFIMIKE